MWLDATLVIALSILVNFIACNTLEEAVHAPMWTFDGTLGEIPYADAMGIREGVPLKLVARGGYIVGYILENSVRPLFTHEINSAIIAIRISDGKLETIRTRKLLNELGIFEDLPANTPHDARFKLSNRNPLQPTYRPNLTADNHVRIDYAGNEFLEIDRHLPNIFH